MVQKYIEYDLPLREISHFSAKEKIVGAMQWGHPSLLHVWWARRPLTASRATIYASLIPLPKTKDERDKVDEKIKTWPPEFQDSLHGYYGFMCRVNGYY